jgi:hypothetical protein
MSLRGKEGTVKASGMIRPTGPGGRPKERVQALANVEPLALSRGRLTGLQRTRGQTTRHERAWFAFEATRRLSECPPCPGLASGRSPPALDVDTKSTLLCMDHARGWPNLNSQPPVVPHR